MSAATLSAPMASTLQAEYRRDGFVIVRGLYDPAEMVEACCEADRTAVIRGFEDSSPA